MYFSSKFATVYKAEDTENDNKIVAVKKVIFYQNEKFENCAGDFQARMTMWQIVLQFELKMHISAYNFYIQYK